MSARWSLLVIGGLACGDNTARDEVFTARSGSRLALQWYGYTDGTRQPEAAELYDTQLHARCTPRPWIDDVVRCVPEADDAVYVDAACTEPIGRALTIAEPTHFIVRDRIGGDLRPARIFPAGEETAAVAESYQRLDGACAGPFANPPGITYHALSGELPGSELVPIRDGELGEGRLALRVRTTDDGLQVPLGLRDRELDRDCTATARPDGGVTCEPTGAVPATHFRDPACGEPVILVDDEAPVPTIARVVEASGCASYHAVGPEVAATLYRRDGEACRPAAVVPAPRVFTVEAALELPALGRTLEAIADRRLQRIVLDAGELRFFDDLLFDTAIGADCRRHRYADVTRCIPAALSAVTTLFTPSCVVPVRVTELPERSCDRPAFATATTAAGIDLHAIGDRVAGPLLDGACRPYAAAPGTVLHTLGPPIDPTAFMGAIYFGER